MAIDFTVPVFPTYSVAYTYLCYMICDQDIILMFFVGMEAVSENTKALGRCDQVLNVFDYFS